MKHIQNALDDNSSDSSDNIFKQRLHKIVTDPRNYELLVGRIHSHSATEIHRLLNLYEGRRRIAKSNAMVAYMKQIVNMSIAIYSVRQNILNEAKTYPEKTRIQLD